MLYDVYRGSFTYELEHVSSKFVSVVNEIETGEGSSLICLTETVSCAEDL